EKRFPFVRFNGTTTFSNINKSGPVLRIFDNHQSSTFWRCILVNSFLGAIRVKSISYMNVINKSFSQKKYLEFLPQTLGGGDDVRGAAVFDNENAKKLMVASQFTNLFLMNKLRETTIGEFLRIHPEIL